MVQLAGNMLQDGAAARLQRQLDRTKAVLNELTSLGAQQAAA